MSLQPCTDEIPSNFTFAARDMIYDVIIVTVIVSLAKITCRNQQRLEVSIIPVKRVMICFFNIVIVLASLTCRHC